LVAQLGEHETRQLVADGRLRRLWPGILVPRDLLLDPLARAEGALLRVGPEGALTSATAAWLHGCGAAAGPEVHVAMPYSRSIRSHPGLVVHQGAGLLDEIIDVRGLAAVPLDVAVTELLCTGARRHALVIADQAAAMHRPCDRPEWCAGIAALLDRRRDRRGTVRAADLLDLVTGKADSPPESGLRLLVVDAGFPPPIMQFEVVDVRGEVRYILDLSWPDLRIALEYDGHDAHDGRDAEDAQRESDLVCRGWLVVRARAEDIREPERLLRALDDAFRRRGAAAGPSRAERPRERRRARG